MEMFVQNESRPDLGASVKMTQDSLRGYGFAKVFPMFRVPEKSGTVYVAPSTLTNAEGVKDRADGSALAATDLATSAVAFAVARLEGRARIFENEMHGFQSMDAACAAGSKIAGRKLLNTLEKDVSAAVFSSARRTAATVLANHAVVSGLQKLAISVRAYGSARLAFSTNGFLVFCNIPEIRVLLKTCAKVNSDAAYLALTNPAIRTAIANLMYFDDIAIFDSNIVGTTYDTFIGVYAARPESFTGDAMLVAKTDATLGGLMTYLPDTAQPDCPMSLFTSANYQEKANYFDGEAWLQILEFNAAACVLGAMTATYTEYGETPAA